MNTRQSILDAAKVVAEKGVIAKELVSVTLTREQYKRLEDEFPPRITDNPTLAAIQLGQQQVLRAVRNGFVA